MGGASLIIVYLCIAIYTEIIFCNFLIVQILKLSYLQRHIRLNSKLCLLIFLKGIFFCVEIDCPRNYYCSCLNRISFLSFFSLPVWVCSHVSTPPSTLDNFLKSIKHQIRIITKHNCFVFFFFIRVQVSTWDLHCLNRELLLEDIIFSFKNVHLSEKLVFNLKTTFSATRLNFFLFLKQKNRA